MPPPSKKHGWVSGVGTSGSSGTAPLTPSRSTKAAVTNPDSPVFEPSPVRREAREGSQGVEIAGGDRGKHRPAGMEEGLEVEDFGSQDEDESCDSEEESFGQKVDLTVRLKEILAAYPRGSWLLAPE